jgi:hypothetical protein
MPFSGVKLNYREINSKEQLILAKSNVLLPSGEEFDSEYSSILKKIVSNCVENKEDFYKLNLIDYILFVTKLRIISLGSELVLSFENKEGAEGSKINVNLELNVFMKLLYDAAVDALKDNVLEFNGIKVTLGWPNINSEYSFFEKKDISNLEHILSSLCEYVKTITINDSKVIDLDAFNRKERVEIYEKLPISLRTQIQIKVLNCIKDLSEKNLFNIAKMDYFTISFYNNNYLNLVRLFFSGDLKNIYQEYYVLASRNINPNFVNGLSISDRRVFCSFIEEEVKNQKEASTSIPINKNTTSLQDLMDEFKT